MKVNETKLSPLRAIEILLRRTDKAGMGIPSPITCGSSNGVRYVDTWIPPDYRLTLYWRADGTTSIQLMGIVSVKHGARPTSEVLRIWRDIDSNNIDFALRSIRWRIGAEARKAEKLKGEER